MKENEIVIYGGQLHIGFAPMKLPGFAILIGLSIFILFSTSNPINSICPLLGIFIIFSGLILIAFMSPINKILLDESGIKYSIFGVEQFHMRWKDIITIQRSSDDSEEYSVSLIGKNFNYSWISEKYHSKEQIDEIFKVLSDAINTKN